MSDNLNEQEKKDVKDYVDFINEVLGEWLKAERLYHRLADTSTKESDVKGYKSSAAQLKNCRSDLLELVRKAGDAGPVGTEKRVCEDITRRQQMGIAKYGMTVEGNPLPLRAWLQHQYEELLDAAVYTRRAIEEMDKAQEPQSNVDDMCKKCGGVLKPGFVILPGVYASEDFGGDAGQPGTTMSEGTGTGKRKPCLKCVDCGHTPFLT